MASASDGLRRRSEALKDFQHDALKKHGANMKRKLVASAASATGGDRRLSGLGPKPILGVTLRTEKGSKTSTVTLVPSPKAARGPWVWIQDGTRPGMRRRSRRAGVSRRNSQITGSGSYYHPGTSGSNAWFGVTDAELPKIAAELRRQFNVAGR